MSFSKVKDVVRLDQMGYSLMKTTKVKFHLHYMRPRVYVINMTIPAEVALDPLADSSKTCVIPGSGSDA